MYADDNDAGKLQIGIFTVFSLFIYFYFIYIYMDVFHNLFPLYLYVKYLKLLFKNYYYICRVPELPELSEFIGVIP